MSLTAQGRNVIASRRFESARWIGFELSVLAIWTLYLLRNFLNLDPLVAPYGPEYFDSMQSHFMWDRARECGLCALWNGYIRGGYPATVEIHDSTLFPPVIVASLIWGALNGAKVALVVTFFLAGFSQWWLARVLGLGRVARVWSGAMAVAAGGLAGRLDNGNIALVMSTVCCMLALPPAIQLSRDGTRRTAAILGIVFAFVIVAGQGYLQIGFAMLSSLFLILIAGSPIGLKPMLKRYALACVIGVLVAAPFLVPFLLFYPSMYKDIDPNFGSTQPFRYVLLNLVIDDPYFANNQVFGMLPYPYFYANFVGWIPIVFATIGCFALFRRQQYRLLSFLLGWFLGAMWISSAVPLRWISDATSPDNFIHKFVIGIRNAGLIAGIAIPAVLALAAIGVDSLMKVSKESFQLNFSISSRSEVNRVFRLDPRWLLIIPLVFALRAEKRFDSTFLRTTRQPIEAMAPVLDALTTPDLQWVNPPYGEHFWIGQAMDRNLKLGKMARGWSWAGRTEPFPVLWAASQTPAEGMSQVGTASGLGIFAAPTGNEYAAVTHADGTRAVCSAQGIGGNIDVTCDLAQPGRLEIKENYYSGWNAKTADGESLDVANAAGWMTVDLPAGQSTIEFRYRPWDVPAGVLLMFVGLGIAGYCLIRREPNVAAANEQSVIDFAQPAPSGEGAAAN